MSFGRSPGTPGMHGSNQRTKRMRTSFKHHQLRTMKSYFSINHNPDAKDLKQLSQKTGLPKRVLQVIQSTFVISIIYRSLYAATNHFGIRLVEISGPRASSRLVLTRA